MRLSREIAVQPRSSTHEEVNAALHKAWRYISITRPDRCSATPCGWRLHTP